jgi:hypothetical protein
MVFVTCNELSLSMRQATDQGKTMVTDDENTASGDAIAPGAAFRAG